MHFLSQNTKLILASGSPRRQQLLKELGIPYEIRLKEVNETYPEHLKRENIAEYLAQKKADVHQEDLQGNEIVLTSDTVVWHKGQSLAKAGDKEEAYTMLQNLSGDTHEVISSVCLLSQNKKSVFSDIVKVHFRRLSEEEIWHYINHYHPYDKAGAYGIQEWIGMIGITAIEGSYFTVMGLPTHLVVENLRAF